MFSSDEDDDDDEDDDWDDDDEEDWSDWYGVITSLFLNLDSRILISTLFLDQ